MLLVLCSCAIVLLTLLTANVCAVCSWSSATLTAQTSWSLGIGPLSERTASIDAAPGWHA